MSEAKKILIAEDNAEMRKVLAIRLEINGFKVVAAENGEEALEKAKGEKPDLLILDLMLPKVDGFEVCRKLKFDDKFKNTPIIILSALDQQVDKEKAMQSGADEYLVKPFNLDLLLKKINSLITK